MAEDVYTDDQVVEACDLHIDNIRKLIQWGAVAPNAGAGGRGRKRFWTIDQIQRICLTSSFFRSGMSLRMAHTLSYCLPLDEFCAAHDPRVVGAESGEVNYFHPEEVRPDIPPWDDYVATVEIINGAYVFSSILGDTSYFYGFIDNAEPRFYSAWGVGQYFYGPYADHVQRADKRPGLERINRDSLLYTEMDLNSIGDIIAESQTFYSSPRRYTMINLGLDMIICMRKIIGLDVIYPYVNEYYDRHNVKPFVRMDRPDGDREQGDENVESNFR